MKYSTKMLYYSDVRQSQLYIPDDILTSEGVACGDSINILASLSGDILTFQAFGDCCIQSRAMLGYLYSRFNGTNVEGAVRDGQDTYGLFSSDPQKLAEAFQCEPELLRLDCLLKPMEVFLAFVETLPMLKRQSHRPADTRKSLDCDACVSTGRLDWGASGGTEDDDSDAPEEISYPKEYREKWFRLAKIHLSEYEKGMFLENCNSITQEDVDFFGEKKIDQMLFYNMKKYGCPIDSDTYWKDILYRLHRKEIVAAEIEAVRAYISDNGLRAYFIKGARTQELYKPDKGIRIFLDYDIIADSTHTAFQIVTFLFNRGFTLFTGVFSLKKVRDKNNNELYSGHCHLQKLIGDQYKVIVDINFPAFPMGRIALYYPEKITDGEISWEDQFIITLCHLFKHKDAFMKDINDLALMIAKADLNLKEVMRRVEENGLQLFCMVALQYIAENYELSQTRKSEIYSLADISGQELNDWPYSEEQVYLVKKSDLEDRLISGVDNLRIYLFPLALFTKPFELSDEMCNNISEKIGKVDCCETGIYFMHTGVGRLVLTTMGLFWDNSNSMVGIEKSAVETVVRKTLEICRIDHILKVPYLLKDRDIWYD